MEEHENPGFYLCTDEQEHGLVISCVIVKAIEKSVNIRINNSFFKEVFMDCTEAEAEIRKIFHQCTSECAILDFKVEACPSEKFSELLKDIDAMLNSEEGFDQNKVILFGVNKDRELVGISSGEMKDDNEFQNLVNKITPRPMILTGEMELDGKNVGYCFISKDNKDRIYTINTTLVEKSLSATKEILVKKSAFRGQCFTRHGSENAIIDQEEWRKIAKHLNDAQASFDAGFLIREIPSELITALMIGGWDGEFSGDRCLIGNLAMQSYDSFICSFRKAIDEKDTFVLINGSHWKIKIENPELFPVFQKILPEDLRRYQEMVKKVFSYFDHGSTSLPEHGGQEENKFSPDIMKGISIFLAFSGNNKELFHKSVAKNIENLTSETIRQVLCSVDLKSYNAYSDVIEFLAESNPLIFLDCFQRNIEDQNSSLAKYLSQKNGLFNDWNKMAYFYALRQLAADKQYFSTSFFCMYMMAKEDNELIQNMAEMIVPWHPQTTASAKMRSEIIKKILHDDPTIGRQLLYKLLPGVINNVAQIDSHSFLSTDFQTRIVTLLEFQDESRVYVDLMCNISYWSKEEILKMISVWEKSSKENREKIGKKIVNETRKLADKDIEEIWIRLDDSSLALIRNGKKDDLLFIEIDDLKTKIADDREFCYSNHKLFRREQYKLSYADLEDNSRERLQKEQQEVVQRVFEEKGLAGVIEFASSCENPCLVGSLFPNIKHDAKTLHEVSAIGSYDKYKYEFKKGFIKTIKLFFYEEVCNYCSGLSEKELLEMAEISPQHDAEIRMVRTLPPESQTDFWKRIEVDDTQFLKQELSFVIKSLADVMRINEALSILRTEIFEKKLLDPDLIVYVLKSIPANNKSRYDNYSICFLIGWLQENCPDKTAVAAIELRNIERIGFETGTSPLCIYELVDKDPKLFLKFVENIDKKNEKLKFWFYPGETKRMYFWLLESWRHIPCSKEEVNDVELKQWMELLLKDENDSLNYALDIIGKAFFHSPLGDHGFFIDRTIACYLDDPRCEFLRKGYRLEAFNSVGLISTNNLKTFYCQKALEFKAKSERANEEGYFQLAALLQHIEADFEAEKEREWYD